MANEPVRQHWLPRTYLRAFCAVPVEREQIHVFDLAEGRAFKTSITNVAVARHLYTLGLAQGEPSYAVENALSRLESDVSPVLAQIVETEELTANRDERRTLAHFLATLSMRTRQGLQSIHAWRDAMREGYSTPDGDVPPSDDAELLGLDEVGMRELFAKAAISVGRSLTALVDGMHWRLIRATEDYLITSENPLVVYHSTEKQWGLGTPGVHIHFALSPSLVLHLGHEIREPGDRTFDLRAGGVRGLNGLTILSAEQYLYSHAAFDSDSMQTLLQDRPKGTRREFGPPRIRL